MLCSRTDLHGYSQLLTVLPLKANPSTYARVRPRDSAQTPRHEAREPISPLTRCFLRPSDDSSETAMLLLFPATLLVDASQSRTSFVTSFGLNHSR
jgi:hypothetical protein